MCIKSVSPTKHTINIQKRIDAHVSNSIENFNDPVMDLSWGELGFVNRTMDREGVLHVDATLGYPVAGLQTHYSDLLDTWLGRQGTVLDLKFEAPRGQALAGVRNVIAVASGKGGVGKSTVAVNLALALARCGAKVGLLDADIYGPSQGLMLGIPEGRRPEVAEEKYFVPIRVHGIEAISMSMLVSERTPMVWRGPMASGALQQMLQQTRWSNVDYLVVDMPPGTGDIQLTLSQQVTVGGAVIVTTPQSIALSDARKGIEMFTKVKVPILGIVENMSYFVCDGCGKRHQIFDKNGGVKVAEEYNTRLLNQLPLDENICMQTDAGSPPVVSDPESEVTAIFVDTALQTAAALWLEQRAKAPAPTISIKNS